MVVQLGSMTLAYTSLRISASRFMSETWLEQHSLAAEALCVNNNGVFVWELADIFMEQQFRATEAFGAPPLSEGLRPYSVGRHQAGKN